MDSTFWAMKETRILKGLVVNLTSDNLKKSNNNQDFRLKQGRTKKLKKTCPWATKLLFQLKNEVIAGAEMLSDKRY